jgi:hypothetical protein
MRRAEYRMPVAGRARTETRFPSRRSRTTGADSARGMWCRPAPSPRRLRRHLGAPGLEELDWVARRILNEDLAAGRSLDDLATEPRPLRSEALNSRVEIGNDDLEPIPASRLGNSTSFARATCTGLVEKQS